MTGIFFIFSQPDFRENIYQHSLSENSVALCAGHPHWYLSRWKLRRAAGGFYFSVHRPYFFSA